MRHMHSNIVSSLALRPAFARAAICSILLAAPHHALAIDATWTAAAGAWSTAANWSTNPLVPNANTFDVFIDDTTAEVEVDGTFTIGDLNWSAGGITGSGELSVEGLSTISGADPKKFAAVTLNLLGDTVWTEGEIQSLVPPEGGVVNNSGTFDVQFGSFWSWTTEAIPVFNNLTGATLLKSAGAVDAVFWPLFHNHGTVHVQSAGLRLEGGGLSTGEFLVDAGATLQFSDFAEGFSGAGAETTTLDVTSVIDSEGTVIFGNNFGSSRTDLYGTIDSPLIVADPGPNGLVFFHQGTILGSNLRGSLTANSGVTLFENVFSLISDLTVNADAVAETQTDLNVSGTVTVAGTGVVKIGENLTGVNGSLFLNGAGPRSITGDGTIRMEGSGGSSIDPFIGTLDIGADVKIIGKGQIGAGENHGTITADAPLSTMRTTGLKNSGLIQGLTGGTIDFRDAINAGTIEVSGGGNLQTTNVDNRGTLSINGGALNLSGANWTNSDSAGVINATNASINLRGDFTFADLGVINRTNSQIFLQGTLQNTSQTLNLDNSTGARGTWIMNDSGNSRIVGGAIQTSGGAEFVIRGSSGVFQGVTLNSAPTFENGSSLFVMGGLTLNNVTLDLSAAGAGAAGISFTDAGTRFINGTGTFVLGDTDGRGISNSFGSLATIGPNITIRGNRGFVGGTSKVLLQGKVSADVAAGAIRLDDVTIDVAGVAEAKNGGRLLLASSWDNNGTIKVENNSFLDLAGTFDTPDIGVIQRTGTTTVQLFGTLTNTAQTLDLHTSTGTLLLRSGGTIGGGAVTSSGASTLQVLGTDIGGPVLDGVSLGANLAFVGGGSGGALTVRNGLTFTGGAAVDLGGLGRALNFTGSAPQTVGGTGTILLNSGAGSNLIRNSMSGGAAVTIGPNVTVRGSGFSLNIDGNFSGGAGGISNQGLIRAEGAGTSMILSRVTNAGGTIRVDAGASLAINPSISSTSFVQTAGELSIGGAATSSALVAIQGGKLSGTGSLRVNGTAATARVQVGTGGTISPGDSIGTLTVDGDVFLDAGSHLAVEISGAASADKLSIIKGSFQAAAGDLDLSSLTDFLDVTVVSNIVPGNDYLIATYAGTLTGTFDNVTAGMSVIYDTPNKSIFVRPLSLVDDADFNDDGTVDGTDFLAWQRNVHLTTGATHAQGDANNDGDVDNDDLTTWKNTYGTNPATIATTPVPEPAAWLLLIAALPLLGRRHQQHG